MRDFGKVCWSFWTGETGRLLRRNPDAQRVGLYLVSGPHSNMTGLYYLALPTVAHEVGLTVDQAREAMRHLERVDFAHYDEEAELVFVPGMAGRQIEEQLQPTDKRVPGIVRELLPFRKHRFFAAFLERYGEAFNLTDAMKPRPKAPSAPKAAPAKPLESPSEGPSKPLRSQEQEQEQDLGGGGGLNSEERENFFTPPPPDHPAGALPDSEGEPVARWVDNRIEWEPSARGAWEFIQLLRHEHGFPREGAVPKDWGPFVKRALAEAGQEGFAQTYLGFLRDKSINARNHPTSVFVRCWDVRRLDVREGATQ